jgi:hypothetical protein
VSAVSQALFPSKLCSYWIEFMQALLLLVDHALKGPVCLRSYAAGTRYGVCCVPSSVSIQAVFLLD